MWLFLGGLAVGIVLVWVGYHFAENAAFRDFWF